jgi:hypothetical protein
MNTTYLFATHINYLGVHHKARCFFFLGAIDHFEWPFTQIFNILNVPQIETFTTNKLVCKGIRLYLTYVQYKLTL